MMTIHCQGEPRKIFYLIIATNLQIQKMLHLQLLSILTGVKNWVIHKNQKKSQAYIYHQKSPL
ncbi:Uncharacterised protein [Chlamydia abortus]|nr:hypothetical protein CEF07_05065 [Chlamydia abortus]SGA23803.1 Uncharacterised protein [Chlamydia abortus]